MVLCSGSFDGLHSGHVRYLRAAQRLVKREHFEALVVAVAPDGYSLRLKGRPTAWPQADRVLTVSAMAGVDRAIAQEAESVADTIRGLKPRLFVKGEDWRDRLPEDVLAACDAVGTDIVYVDTPGRHVADTRSCSGRR